MNYTRQQIKASSKLVSLLRPPPSADDHEQIIFRSSEGVLLAKNKQRTKVDHTLMYKYQGFMDSKLQQSCLDHSEIEDLDRVFERVRSRLRQQNNKSQALYDTQNNLSSACGTRNTTYNHKFLARRHPHNEHAYLKHSFQKDEEAEAGFLNFGKMGHI